LEKDSHTIRALMQCGHAIGSQTMFNYVYKLLENTRTQKICCPVPTCRKEWLWDDISAVANMTQEEEVYFSSILEKRNLHGIKRCPYCQIFCERPPELNEFRVRCSNSNCKKKRLVLDMQ